jgi:hypothetical protein
MNLKDILQCYLDAPLRGVTRRFQFDLAKAEARAHILEGLKIAVDNLNEVVRIIRESRDRGGREAAVDEALRADRDPDQRDPGHAAVPADRAGAREAGGGIPEVIMEINRLATCWPIRARSTA